jgi:hypothetical protein
VIRAIGTCAAIYTLGRAFSDARAATKLKRHLVAKGYRDVKVSRANGWFKVQCRLPLPPDLIHQERALAA